MDEFTFSGALLNFLLRKNGFPEISHEQVTSYIGEGLKAFITDVLPQFKDQPDVVAQMEQEFHDEYKNVILDNPQIFPGAVEFLDRYDGPIAIVSNKKEADVRILLDHLGLNRYKWLAVIGGDSLSERKPHPLPLEYVMDIAKRPASKSIMIGDGYPDVGAAKAAGVPCIAVDFGFSPAGELLEMGAQAKISHFNQLEEKVENLLS